jgi:sec-independent protein translocase protein TatB
MLPQIGSSELLLIAVIALIVVGPKDLPILLRKVGQFIARLRGMANDFRTSFDDMARQSELEDLRREVAAMRDAATAESNALNDQVAQLSEEVHSGAQLQMPPLAGPPPQAEPFDPDPEAYRYAQETPAEKIIKRRARVAAAEGAEAKPARKPRAAAAKAEAPTAAKPKSARKAATKAKP